jgi:hypothetical protein
LDKNLVTSNPTSGILQEYGFQTQKLDDILDNEWKISLQQAGIGTSQCVDIYGVDGSTLNSIDYEFYYPGEHLTDPAGIGKSYTTEEITRMLEDIEDYSVASRQDFDE